MVARRFAELVAGGADPAGIIAFTFTERAAEELKARISARVEERLGPQALDRLGVWPGSGRNFTAHPGKSNSLTTEQRSRLDAAR